MTTYTAEDLEAWAEAVDVYRRSIAHKDARMHEHALRLAWDFGRMLADAEARQRRAA